MISIITKECFAPVVSCLVTDLYNFCSNDKINWSEQGDREAYGEKNCDQYLNEYWPYCGKPVTERRYCDSIDWDDE